MAPLLVLGLPPGEVGAYSPEEGVEGTGEAAVEAGGDPGVRVYLFGGPKGGESVSAPEPLSAVLEFPIPASPMSLRNADLYPTMPRSRYRRVSHDQYVYEPSEQQAFRREYLDTWTPVRHAIGPGP